MFMVVALVVALVSGAGLAQAAEPVNAHRRTGIDISWPQCGKQLPTEISFAIIGVNGGTAATTNNCLAEQLSWAFAATTGADPSQPPVQLYVNTANPGEILEEYAVATWPTDNLDSRGADSYADPKPYATLDPARRNPHGACLTTPESYRGYTNSLACSWQYGWNRAVEAVDQRFAPAARSVGVSDAATDYMWWLDVETMNSWQKYDAEASAKNAASLEGMKQFFDAEGIVSGLYSTSYQWGQIVGNTLEMPNPDPPAVGGNLRGAISWLAGAIDAADARIRCGTLEGLTGGPVVMNQYIEDDLDFNYSCL